jgi:hypothetical protein
MILSDFNLIASAADKSNANINLRLLGQFRSLIQDLELIEYPLFGRKYTWSNERELATHTRIDRVLVSKEWELQYPQLQLTLASSNVSDHCPLLVSKMERKHFAGFRFEAHWLKHEDFLTVAKGAWEKPVVSTDAVRALHTKISRTAKALKKWNKDNVKWTKFASAVADEVIFNLDVAQEDRSLSPEERRLRSMLKSKLPGFAAIDRMRWKQRSRINWIREEDANTKFFHLRANGRRRKNHIPTILGQMGIVSDHGEKAEILLQHFTGLMGSRVPADVDLN